MNPEPVEPPPAKKHKNLYDSFVTARDREERGLAAVGDLPGSIGLSSNARISNPDRPRQGNTVYVYGYHVRTFCIWFQQHNNQHFFLLQFSYFFLIFRVKISRFFSRLRRRFYNLHLHQWEKSLIFPWKSKR
jgi:hypothetical protein